MAKLWRHLERKYSQLKGIHTDYFKRKYDELVRNITGLCCFSCEDNRNTLEASYRMSYCQGRQNACDYMKFNKAIYKRNNDLHAACKNQVRKFLLLLSQIIWFQDVSKTCLIVVKHSQLGVLKVAPLLCYSSRGIHRCCWVGYCAHICALHLWIFDTGRFTFVQPTWDKNKK